MKKLIVAGSPSTPNSQFWLVSKCRSPTIAKLSSVGSSTKPGNGAKAWASVAKAGPGAPTLRSWAPMRMSTAAAPGLSVPTPGSSTSTNVRPETEAQAANALRT